MWPVKEDDYTGSMKKRSKKKTINVTNYEKPATHDQRRKGNKRSTKKRLVSWCFEPSQSLGVTSGLDEEKTESYT